MKLRRRWWSLRLGLSQLGALLVRTLRKRYKRYCFVCNHWSTSNLFRMVLNCNGPSRFSFHLGFYLLAVRNLSYPITLRSNVSPVGNLSCPILRIQPWVDFNDRRTLERTLMGYVFNSKQPLWHLRRLFPWSLIGQLCSVAALLFSVLCSSTAVSIGELCSSACFGVVESHALKSDAVGVSQITDALDARAESLGQICNAFAILIYSLLGAGLGKSRQV